MPAWSKTFQHVAPDGSVVTGIACGRSPRRRCSVPNCSADATLQCDFPVRAPSRKSTTCDRWLCRQHAKSVGPDRDYCLPHVRADQALRSVGGSVPTPSVDEPFVVVGPPAQLGLALDPPLTCADCGQPFAVGDQPARRWISRGGAQSYLPGVYHKRCAG